MAAIDALGKKGGLYAVVAGAAHVARAVAAGKVPDRSSTSCCKRPYEYSPIAKASPRVASGGAPREMDPPPQATRPRPAGGVLRRAWRYFDTCPTTKIAEPSAPARGGGSRTIHGRQRKQFADPVLKALADAFRAAGNDADAKRPDEATQS